MADYTYPEKDLKLIVAEVESANFHQAIKLLINSKGVVFFDKDLQELFHWLDLANHKRVMRRNIEEFVLMLPDILSILFHLGGEEFFVVKQLSYNDKHTLRKLFSDASHVGLYKPYNVFMDFVRVPTEIRLATPEELYKVLIK